MERVAALSVPRVSTLFLCCLSVSLPVLASPPNNKALAPDRPEMSAANFHTGSDSHNAGASQPNRLDLRPPAASDFTAFGGAKSNVEPAQAAPDAGNERFAFARRSDTAEEQSSFAALGAQTQAMSRAQAFADRFRREGLPVARLWENHSALVSLGLNQKGKPGLWLVQKTH